jgi:hypothetical protein
MIEKLKAHEHHHGDECYRLCNTWFIQRQLWHRFFKWFQHTTKHDGSIIVIGVHSHVHALAIAYKKISTRACNKIYL